MSTDYWHHPTDSPALLFRTLLSGEYDKGLLFAVPRGHEEVARLEDVHSATGGLREGMMVNLANGQARERPPPSARPLNPSPELMRLSKVPVRRSEKTLYAHRSSLVIRFGNFVSKDPGALALRESSAATAPDRRRRWCGK